MKKFNAIIVFLLVCFIYSCKEKEQVTPTVSSADLSAQTAKVPHFDEKNSITYNWDKLPAELRNAIPIVSGKSNANAREAGSNYSYYSYYIGPWGGSGGGYFDMLPPSGSRIYAIAMQAGSLVDRLIVWYIGSNGSIYVGGDVGGNGGAYYLQYFSGDEYISSVGGRSGAYLDRLTIITNYKSFSYGGNGGAEFFKSALPGYQILGFWGHSGAYIDQIGCNVYTR